MATLSDVLLDFLPIIPTIIGFGLGIFIIISVGEAMQKNGLS